MNWTIDLSCGILLASFTGSIFFLAWYAAGRCLEKAGYVGTKYGLLKITVASFFLPVSYVFLKSKAIARQLGHGYLFGKTYGLFLASRIFLAVWGVGMVLFVLLLLWGAWKLHGKLQRLMPCESETCALFEEVFRSLGGRGVRLQLFCSYDFAAPCMCGILHPKVILPAECYGKDELQVIFTHEITHYLQGDMFLNWSVLLLRAVHFFNPFAWLLCREVRKWSEYACDARACKAIGGAKQYFRVIADMALYSSEGALAAQLTESKNELVERMEKMKKMSRNRKAGVMTKLAAVMLAGAVFITGSLSVYAATVRTADGYEYLYHLTDVGVEEEYVPWVNEYEEYTEEGNKEGIVVRTGEVNQSGRTYASFGWTVGGSELVETEAFSCKTGDTISVNLGISPDNISVKVGIIKPDGKKTYILGKGSNVTHEFSVSSAGSYKVFVENGTKTTVEIIGGSYRVY